MDYYYYYYFENPNYLNNNNSANMASSSSSPITSEFMLSDYLVDLDDHHSIETDQSSSEKAASSSDASHVHGGFGHDAIITTSSINNNNNMKCKNENKVEVSSRVTFRTRSQVEIMDDGYKWRKYGKKSVKNSPNPRNYYKCSGEGCNVKKRVERDRDDSNYVLTTYEGIHNHESPASSYYSSSSANYYTLSFN